MGYKSSKKFSHFVFLKQAVLHQLLNSITSLPLSFPETRTSYQLYPSGCPWSLCGGGTTITDSL